MPIKKRCLGCGVLQPLGNFFKSADRPDGHKARCKSCPGGAKGKIVQGGVEEKLPPVVEHRLKAKVAQQEMRIKQLLGELDTAQKFADYAREAGKHKIISIKPRERNSKIREGTALVCASDWHIEEEVKPEQVSGRNRYNLEISERRMQRFFEATRFAIGFNRQAFKIRDLVLWLGGDIITNYLRDENMESNLLSPPRAIAYAVASIAAGINFLLEDKELERIVVPCNDGNHGRLVGVQKLKHGTRVDNSLEWLMYTMLAREFKNEPRVQFKIASGELLYLDIYGRQVRFVHGDVVKYAGGVGGVTIPLYKAIARWDTMRQAALTVLGHFHQYTSLSDLLINGSLIGHSPYSVTIGARFEAPQQAFCMLDPHRFKSVSMPLWVGERADDDVNWRD